MRSIKELDVSGKKVLVRVDFNVPMDKHQNITDDTRIRSVLSTLRYVLDNNGTLIIMSHMGRPKGKIVPELSLAPVAKRLGRLLQQNIKMATDCIGPDVKKMVSEMNTGDILLLENLRFYPGEQSNDDELARELASLCDIYINNAFAVSHREHASVAAITRFAPQSAAGFLLIKELDYFHSAMDNPRRPLVAIVGGAKVSSKLGALKNMLGRVNKFIIGGAMANTFLKSQGINIGKSLVEEDLVEEAGEIMKRAISEGIKFYLPVDAVVANQIDPDAESKIVPIQEIPADWMALDIGPATSRLFEEVLHDAKTIVWNGPMGIFEMDAFSRGTVSMVHSVANSYALTIVGGGDTDVAVHSTGQSDRFSYISTGGGAFLYLMEGKILPGVAALDNIS
ncbi:MAG: phosphoglycerate kinase [Desulfobacteraceae bacterium]|jgi:phosphoglycerate kinase|nr:phosphoglycerate kinase [Desulfobacteraceae bacterium]